MITTDLGTELDLYHALAQHGPLTCSELADRAGVAPRYALDGQHARVLLDPDDAAHAALTPGGTVLVLDVLPAENDFLRLYRLHP